MMILIVDDAPLIRYMLIDYLVEAGYAATAAADGRDAIDCLHTWPVQLVLLDVMMPVMNGWQTLYAMHADPALATIPVIVMTAAADVRDIALGQGAVGYLPKPLDFQALLEVVHYYVGDRAMSTDPR